MLEPYDGKLSCTVLRRESGSNPADLAAKLHTLEIGDEIILTTKLGTRSYKVVSVEKVQETDRSAMEMTTDNCLTLYTCVKNESAWRWCIRALELV